MCKPLQTALEQGRALVFFDGLDEVPPRWRHTVLKSLEGFDLGHSKSRMLVTCRTATYEQVDWRLSPGHFAVFRVAPFDGDKIRRFVEAWYEEMALRWNQPVERNRVLAAKLNEALRRPDMARLAPNPLLLTVMALVHTRDMELPDYRAVLYERCVDILLWRWERRKQDDGEELELMGRLRQAVCSEKDLLRVLWKLAFKAHEQGGLGDDAEQVAGLEDAVLIKALAQLHCDKGWQWAKQLVDLMRHRTGLLVEREPGVFAFPHRTFQEYLAGVHLASQSNFISTVTQLASQGPFWREVILLAVGYLVHVRGDYDPILNLVGKLCPPHPSQTDSVSNGEDEVYWRKIRLAGESILEMGLQRFAKEEGGEELLQRVRQRLTDLLEQGRLAPEERLQVGETLGTLGDPRFDAARLYLPCQYRGKAEAHWGFVEIPQGPFWLGSERGDKDTHDDEFGNANPLDLPYRYWMARYPVTVAQFDVFVRADAYLDQSWWKTQAAKAWLGNSGQTAPLDWDAQRLHPNRPAVRVTWFESMAYAAWLDSQLRKLAFGQIPDGYVVRLPTEAEWEKAARSGGQRRYPWGDQDWNPQLANINDSRIGHASPVGGYPLGAIPSGLHEMAGNVWEWNLTAWGDYPYDASRNNPEGDKIRVVRGGSWLNDFGWASRCAYRYWGDPGNGSSILGFRLLVSLGFDS